jgi:hypothetical protein
VQAPERYLGLYIGSVSALVLYWICCQFHEAFNIKSYSKEFNSERHFNIGTNVVSFASPFYLGGVDCAINDPWLFYSTLVLVLISVSLWLKLVWLDTDPGTVDTRFYDFDAIMEKSIEHMGQPPAQLYCRTSLVKKPLRSKYCASTGLVIARMDHHCVWLQNSIGHGNHRTFFMFLLTQMAACGCYLALVVREIVWELGGKGSSSCSVLGNLLSTEYFLLVVIVLALSVCLLCMAGVLGEQLGNMLMNTTTNERINQSRYPWMTDENGNPHNRFDRGYTCNFLEFWKVPGYSYDYMSCFEMPAKRSEAMTLGELSQLNNNARKDNDVEAYLEFWRESASEVGSRRNSYSRENSVHELDSDQHSTLG